jgi:HD-GYP domain-containing protein (c-di-GMP phosphodiesterase class II)
MTPGNSAKVKKSRFGNKILDPKSKAPFLRYRTEERNSLLTKHTETLKKAPPPSTRKFSQVIQNLYPRDVQLVNLNWWERWQLWAEERKNKKVLSRSRLRFSPRKNRPAYIPDDFPLVNYHDQVPLQQELKSARLVIEKTDSLLERLHADFLSMHSLELSEVQPTIQLLTDSVIANPSAMMWLLRMRSENSVVVTHALKVAVYMIALGRHIGFARQQLVELGFIGLLLDIGKLEMPKNLLQKPEKLSAAEASIIQTHVNVSLAILESGAPLSPNIKQGINEHHERMDGSGYPKGLSGIEISIFGRIAAIADSFAAMTSPRPYDITRSSFDAMKELFRMAKWQLYEPLVEEFVQAVGIFPVGSLIQLTTGEVAIVLEHNRIRRLEPKVLLLTDINKALLDKPMLFDIMRQIQKEGQERVSIMRGLPDGAYGLVCQDFYRA